MLAILSEFDEKTIWAYNCHMRTFTITILLLIAIGVAFNYIFEHRDVVTDRMGRFCDAWSDCDEAGERVIDGSNVNRDVFGR